MTKVEAATLAVLLGFVAMVFMNIQAAVGPDSPISIGIFNQTTSAVSAKYPTPVTPAGYTFSIWGLIYLWNFAWIVYVVTTLYRQNSGGPVYLNPPATSVSFLASFLVNNAANVLWLLVWDREELNNAAATLLVIALTLYLALYISLTSVFRYLDWFQKIAESDLWAYRVLVHNGLALYASWATVAATVNLSASLIYDCGISGDTATIVSLSILAALLVFFFASDISIIDHYTRYVFMVYPTFIWSLAGIMVANQSDTGSPVFIYAAVLVSLSGVCFIAKTVLMIIREPVYLVVKKAEVKASTYAYTRVI